MANSPAFDVGDRIIISATFRDSANNLVDPTAVWVTHYRSADGTAASATFVYPDDAVVARQSVGVFNYPYLLTAPGEYFFRVASSGTVFGAIETAVQVRTSRF